MKNKNKLHKQSMANVRVS